MKRISTLIALAVAGTVVPSQFVSAADPEVPSVIEVVVRVDTAPAEPTVSATAFDQLLADNSAWVVEPLIESRGVYLLARSVLVKEDKFVEETEKEADDWAKKIEKDDLVLWSEPEREVTVEDRRFHVWPNSGHEDAIEEDLADQHAFAGLSLGTVHQVATGAGTVVAVLDTGVDAAHPMLAGRLLPGYDLIDDDPDPLDVANGVDDDGDGLVDEAYGHGTFVAGVVAQIAPDAAILPVRVLDADGRAELHTVIEGIDLAIEQGANVINMSFGLLGDHEPRPLKEALKRGSTLMSSWSAQQATMAPTNGRIRRPSRRWSGSVRSMSTLPTTSRGSRATASG